MSQRTRYIPYTVVDSVVYVIIHFMMFVALALAIVALVNSAKARTASNRAVSNAISPERVIFFNPVSGNDGNSGTTTAGAVRTFAHALSLFGDGTFLNCTLVVIQNWIVSPEEQPLNFFPAVRQCRYFTVRGVEYNVHNDIVDAVYTVEPLTYNWTAVVLQTGGLSPSLYQGYFVENVNQSRVYVVDDNEDVNMTTIAGYWFEGVPGLPSPPQEVSQEAWLVGEHLRVFTVATQIAWTGVLLVDVPFGQVTFRSLLFMPLTPGSAMRTPDGTDYKVIVEASRLGCQSNNIASYQGSLMFRGCSAFGVAPEALFIASDLDQVTLADSIWMDECSASCTGICNFRFIKSTNSPGDGLVMRGAILTLYNVYISSPELAAVRIIQNSIGDVLRIYIDKSAPGTAVTSAFIVESGAGVVLGSFAVLCDPLVCTEALYINTGASLRITATVLLEGQVLVRALAGGQFHMFNLINNVVITTNTTPFIFDQSTTVWINLSFALTIDATAAPTPVPIIDCNGCSLVLQGPNTNFVLSTAAGAPLIEVRNNGNVMDFTGGSKLSGQGNQGPVPTAVIKCGSLAISSWSVSQFNTVQNAICTR